MMMMRITWWWSVDWGRCLSCSWHVLCREKNPNLAIRQPIVSHIRMTWLTHSVYTLQSSSQWKNFILFHLFYAFLTSVCVIGDLRHTVYKQMMWIATVPALADFFACHDAVNKSGGDEKSRSTPSHKQSRSQFKPVTPSETVGFSFDIKWKRLHSFHLIHQVMEICIHFFSL